MDKKELKIKLNISTQTHREGKYFVIYSSALDLSSYGTSLKSARSNFEEAVAILIEDLMYITTYKR